MIATIMKVGDTGTDNKRYPVDCCQLLVEHKFATPTVTQDAKSKRSQLERPKGQAEEEEGPLTDIQGTRSPPR